MSHDICRNYRIYYSLLVRKKKSGWEFPHSILLMASLGLPVSISCLLSFDQFFSYDFFPITFKILLYLSLYNIL